MPAPQPPPSPPPLEPPPEPSSPLPAASTTITTTATTATTTTIVTSTAINPTIVTTTHRSQPSVKRRHPPERTRRGEKTTQCKPMHVGAMVGADGKAMHINGWRSGRRARDAAHKLTKAVGKCLTDARELKALRKACLPGLMEAIAPC